MSVQSQDTYLNADTTLSVVSGGGGGPAISTFSTFEVSTLSALNITAGYINTGFISSVVGEFDEITCSSLSTLNLSALDIGCSSISTLGLILDGNILTSVGNELLLNGVPIATASSVSTLADWSYDPAISTLNMDGNSTINGSLLSTLTINAGSGIITNLVCNDISTFTLTAQSTIHSISTISSLEIEAQAAVFSSINGAQFPAALISSFDTASVSSLSASTINGAQFPAPLISTFDTASVSSLNASTINGVVFPQPVVNLSQWATLPAISSVYGGSGATDDLNLVATRFLKAKASGANFVVDEGANAAAPATFSVVAQNGNRGDISLTANPGIGGVYGQINLTANGGTTPALLATGGLINLTANTPIGTDPTLTSAIKLSAAGINSYAGAVPSVGSLLGYNFIYGTLGVNLCAGLPSVVPNTPGTIYLYGTTGVTMGSQLDTTSDIVQGAGGIYTTLLTGYWAGGVLLPQNLLIRGRQIPIIGNSYVSLSNVDVLSFDAGASGAITGLQTINGAAYPPASPAFPTALSCATLVASTSVSTPTLFVSSVNGAAYPPNIAVPADLVVSTLNAAQSITTSSITTSSIGANTADAADVYAARLTVKSGLQNSGIYLPGQASAPGISAEIFFGQGIPGSSTIGLFLTNITPSSQALTTQYHSTAFTPGGGIGNIATDTLFLSQDGVAWANLRADAAASTIIASVPMSVSSLINVSSINGAAYPPTAAIPVDLIVSTLTAATSVSTAALFVSSVNGAEYPPPVAGAQSSITNAGSFVEIDGTGTISISTTLTGGTHNLNVDVDNNITLQVENGGIYINNNNSVSHVQLDGAGNIDLLANGSNNINMDSNGGITITAVTPGSVNITLLSTINGIPYPPPQAIPSSIANGGGFINIEGGAISTATGVAVGYSVNSGNLITIDAQQNGILLKDSDFNASIKIYNGITLGPATSSFVIGSAITSVSTLVDVSSINGVAYPPPASTIPSDLIVSTLVAATSVSTPQLFVSSVNGVVYPPPGVVTPSSISNGGGGFVDVDGAGNIIASTNGTYISLASSGIVDIYSPGSDVTIGTGSTIFKLSSGPPSIPSTGLYYNQNGIDAELWINALPIIPPPSAWYSTTTTPQPMYSTFSTLISMVVFPKYTSTFTISATINWLNDGGSSQGDDLEFRVGVSGLAPTGAVTQTITSHLGNAYQATTLLYTGFENFLGFLPVTIDAKKPITSHDYTIQNVVLNVMTDLYD